MVKDEEKRVATGVIDCNASLFLIEVLDDVVRELTFAEKRAVVVARQNNWQIQPGESYRYYEWGELGG